jgi:VPDSG-CTERM motif
LLDDFTKGKLEKGKKGTEKLQSKILSKWVLPLVAAGLLGLASAPSAHGVPTLSISDGLGHTLNLSNSSGGITYAGTLGNFTLNITSGVATGDALLPGLNFSATGTGMLTILFSNTSFGTLPGSISSQISGQTSGITAFATYADTGNRLFGTTTLLSTGGPFSGGAFSGTASATFPIPGPFSLTEKIVIVQSVFGTTSFGTTVKDPVVVGPVVTIPDAGATAPLLGLALLGIGLARRKLMAL